MKHGTLLIKVTGREEAYWLLTLFACYLVWHIGRTLFTDDVAVAMVCIVLAAMAAVKFTVLRTRHICTMDWTLDGENLTLGDQVIPRTAITNVSFRRNKLTNNTWYLNIRTERNIKLESLGDRKQRDASLQSMKELAFALRPELAWMRR